MRIGTEDVFMPAFGTLSDAELAQVSNYLIFQFGGRQGKVTAASVAAQRRE